MTTLLTLLGKGEGVAFLGATGGVLEVSPSLGIFYKPWSGFEYLPYIVLPIVDVL
jgi:hypothetical protein